MAATYTVMARPGALTMESMKNAMTPEMTAALARYRKAEAALKKTGRLHGAQPARQVEEGNPRSPIAKASGQQSADDDALLSKHCTPEGGTR